MKVGDAEVLFRELAASMGPTQVEVGTSGRPPHNYAYLKLMSPSDPEDYAVVSTPGDGWFQLEVTGGFNTGTTSDRTSDDDVRENLERYLRIAFAYLGGRRSTSESGLFKVPFVIVHTDVHDRVKLRLPVQATLKHILKGRGA